jgi:hypothetical protein
MRILASIHPWHSLLSVACLVLGLS